MLEQAFNLTVPLFRKIGCRIGLCDIGESGMVLDNLPTHLLGKLCHDVDALDVDVDVVSKSPRGNHVLQNIHILIYIVDAKERFVPTSHYPLA